MKTAYATIKGFELLQALAKDKQNSGCYPQEYEERFA
jgi:hypothetical protein